MSAGSSGDPIYLITSSTSFSILFILLFSILCRVVRNSSPVLSTRFTAAWKISFPLFSVLIKEKAFRVILGIDEIFRERGER